MPETQPDTQPRADPVSMIPSQIAAKLMESVIGQDEACREMAVLIRQHALSIAEQRPPSVLHRNDPPPLRMPPWLIIGGTGTGKTWLCKVASSLISVPFFHANLCSFSQQGYVGNDESSIAQGLLSAAGGSLARAQTGMVMLDEIDKVRANATPTLDVGGLGVQQALLCLLDGATLQVQIATADTGKRDGRTQPFRTANLLLVAAGSFSAGLSEVIRKRLGGSRVRLGFGAAVADPYANLSEIQLLKRVATEDLSTWGLMNEICGRLANIVVLDQLSPEHLRTILCDAPRGPLAMAQAMARREGFQFRLHDNLVDLLVQQAVDSGLGARSLQASVASATCRALYELPDLIGRRRTSTPIVVELGVQALTDGSFRAIRPRREI